MSSKEVFLCLRDVAKRYGRRQVLKIDALDLHRHQSVLLLGRNGSGKSTLLRILAGISPVDEGAIAQHPIVRKLRLGFLPQSGGLYGDLTVRENMRLRRRLYGLDDIPAVNVWYVDELRLTAHLDRPVSQLSGGFQRLAAIAATLHAAPRWLLLDEPLGGVDAEAKQVLRRHFEILSGKLELCVLAAPTADDDLGSQTRIEVENGQIA